MSHIKHHSSDGCVITDQFAVNKHELNLLLSLTGVSLVLIGCTSPVSNLVINETERNDNHDQDNVDSTPCRSKTNLSETVPFAERLVWHVLELLRDCTWTPS